MPTPAAAEDAAGCGRFEEIVRAACKEHLEPRRRLVRGPRAGTDTVIVSGRGDAAGYRGDAGRPERFEAQLEGGVFGERRLRRRRRRWRAARAAPPLP